MVPVPSASTVYRVPSVTAWSKAASGARGYDVFAVDPNADEVEADRCYHDLREILGGVNAVVIATRPEAAEETALPRRNRACRPVVCGSH